MREREAIQKAIKVLIILRYIVEEVARPREATCVNNGAALPGRQARANWSPPGQTLDRAALWICVR